MDRIQIREGRIDDLPHLNEIYVECMEFHKKTGYDLDKVPEAPQIFLKHVEDIIIMGEALLMVAHTDNRIVGYCVTRIEEKPPVYEETRYGEIDNLAVLGEFQRQGVGEKLFQETVKWLKERGVKRIELMATVGNEKSNNFWQKMGFETFMKVMELKI